MKKIIYILSFILFGMMQYQIVFADDYIDNNTIPEVCSVSFDDGSATISTVPIDSNLRELNILKYYSVATRVYFENSSYKIYNYYNYIHRIITLPEEVDTNKYNLIYLGQTQSGHYIYDYMACSSPGYKFYVSRDLVNTVSYANVNLMIYDDENSNITGRKTNGMDLINSFVNATNNGADLSKFPNLENVGSLENDSSLLPKDAILEYHNLVATENINANGDSGVGACMIFYPEDVLGKTIEVTYTFNFNTFIYRHLSASESFLHPTYSLSNSKSFPEINSDIVKTTKFEIPSTIEEVKATGRLGYTVDDVEGFYYYNELSNKIHLYFHLTDKAGKEAMHENVKNYPLKIGTPKCYDDKRDLNDDAFHPYTNYWKHVGQITTITADCKLYENKRYCEFQLYADCKAGDSSGNLCSYISDRGQFDKDTQGMIAFQGTEPDKEVNEWGKQHGDTYEEILNGNDSGEDNLSFKDSVSFFKSLIKSLKTYPSFFREMLSFLPWIDVITKIISASIIISLVIGFLKLVTG